MNVARRQTAARAPAWRGRGPRRPARSAAIKTAAGTPRAPASACDVLGVCRLPAKEDGESLHRLMSSFAHVARTKVRRPPPHVDANRSTGGTRDAQPMSLETGKSRAAADARIGACAARASRGRSSVWRDHDAGDRASAPRGRRHAPARLCAPGWCRATTARAGRCGELRVAAPRLPARPCASSCARRGAPERCARASGFLVDSPSAGRPATVISGPLTASPGDRARVLPGARCALCRGAPRAMSCHRALERDKRRRISTPTAPRSSVKSELATCTAAGPTFSAAGAEKKTPRAGRSSDGMATSGRTSVGPAGRRRAERCPALAAPVLVDLPRGTETFRGPWRAAGAWGELVRKRTNFPCACSFAGVRRWLGRPSRGEARVARERGRRRRPSGRRLRARARKHVEARPRADHRACTPLARRGAPSNGRWRAEFRVRSPTPARRGAFERGPGRRRLLGGARQERPAR